MLKLRDIRLSKGLKQQDIAEILGITQAAASRIESEERKLDQNQIIKLCLALEVTPDELLGFEEAYNKYTEYLQSLLKDDVEQ
ncbi:Predicted transcriptional regulator [Acholeplasma oculi]|uniref:Cro/Cl family transcriptional regulator n=1 Tax=Acholeplasma oculi TaxID=35623 RepID=A0A061A9V0_9MOLU|nr:helix-turn-helix transcriptional regulator [Acholeplasma oculi]CDR30648.1 Cro/Cl family transcriptional regulator [Acholeplasma oculi]SKC34590.1 Helix-turn-helix [Acholeplasma oculi]SKC45776.1 Helix-turn-helix [Acholeplasma oculi]SUT89401.1 Predicted transcriptional regulator [Acholeplasma oculi]SUU69838.1 Predicted transcriptional regulator [Acholeplasma oculi]